MIQFPPSTCVNRVVPKTAFYRHLDVNTKMKTRFVDDIERIVWLAKLTPSTLNIEDGKAVHEITVFQVVLKRDDVPDDVFLLIDRQMPRHVLFVLQFEEQYRLLLNYKEWIDESKGTFRIISSFRTEWMKGEAIELKIEGGSLDKVYESFTGQISGFGTHSADDTKRIIELQELLKQKQRTIEALQKKVRAEKQFNRQMQLNAEARALKSEVTALTKEIKELKMNDINSIKFQ